MLACIASSSFAATPCSCNAATNRIKTWHSNYGLRSIKNQKKNIFLLTSVGRSAHTVTMLEPDGDALPPEAAMPACRDGEQLPWGGHHCRR